MITVYLLLSAIFLILTIVLIFSYRASSSKESKELLDIKNKLSNINSDVLRIESSVKNEIITNRAETNRRQETQETNYQPRLTISVTLFLHQSTAPQSCKKIN